MGMGWRLKLVRDNGKPMYKQVQNKAVLRVTDDEEAHLQGEMKEDDEM
jgi:hypothetical protein